MRRLGISGGLERAQCVIIQGARDSWKQQFCLPVTSPAAEVPYAWGFPSGWYGLCTITHAFARQIYRTNHTKCALTTGRGGCNLVARRTNSVNHDVYTFHLYLEVIDAKWDTRQSKYSRADFSRGVVCIVMVRTAMRA